MSTNYEMQVGIEISYYNIVLHICGVKPLYCYYIYNYEFVLT